MEKSLVRSSKFLAAAIELLNETGRVDFTVQNVVERSKLSLRAFYQHFGGKDELVLAIFEEVTGVFVESRSPSHSTRSRIRLSALLRTRGGSSSAGRSQGSRVAGR